MISSTSLEELNPEIVVARWLDDRDLEMTSRKTQTPYNSRVDLEKMQWTLLQILQTIKRDLDLLYFGFCYKENTENKAYCNTWFCLCSFIPTRYA